jgi:hypothetical protein
MLYITTSWSKELPVTIFQKLNIQKFIDPVGYLFRFYDLENYIELFVEEQIDIESIITLRTLDFENFNCFQLETEKNRFFELKTTLETYYDIVQA